MNRVPSLAFRVAVAAFVLSSAGVGRIHAQAPAQPPAQTPGPSAATPPPAAETAKPAEDENPFAVKPAPPLPPGMTGSDATDPRFKLTPGLYDAGETSMGIKHLQLLKKPDAFQLGSADPDDPKVQKTLAQLGVGNPAKMPKPLQLEIAQLAFANSDFAFQGTHLFQGNFYGVNIYDISNPANTQLLTSMVCPGGQGDVSVYKNLLFMSVEMPNGRLDCGTQGFPPNPRAGTRSRKRTPLARGAKRPFPRRAHLRYFRHQEPEASRSRSDLPRFAHPHPRPRSQRQRQRLYLRLRHILRPSTGRTRRLLR